MNTLADPSATSGNTPVPAIPAANALRSGASIEVTQFDALAMKSRRHGLPAGTQAFVPWLPVSTPADIVTSARLLRRAGFTPVPHIAARRLKSRTEVEMLLRNLAGEAGVNTVLLIGGDLAQPAGPFDSSLELLGSGVLEQAGMRSIGFAGYPEGHPDITAEVLAHSLADKLRHAKSAGLDAFVVSQFCFDGASIAKWLAGVRAQGHDVPVKIGVAGPAKLRKLLALGIRCGIGNSLRVLKGKAGMMSALLSTHEPGEVVADFQAALPARDAAQVSLHVFAFGGVDTAAAWISCRA